VVIGGVSMLQDGFERLGRQGRRETPGQGQRL